MSQASDKAEIHEALSNQSGDWYERDNWLRQLLEENERLTKERNDHGPEGRNYTNGQYVELLMKYEAMREALEQLIEVYERRQRSAITILDDPDTSRDQWIRVQGKKEVFRVILLELDTILKGEKEHGQIEADQ